MGFDKSISKFCDTKDLAEEIVLEKNKKDNIEVVVDRIVIHPEIGS